MPVKNRITWAQAAALVQSIVEGGYDLGNLTDEQYSACLSICCLVDTFEREELDETVPDDQLYTEAGSAAEEE